MKYLSLARPGAARAQCCSARFSKRHGVGALAKARSATGSRLQGKVVAQIGVVVQILAAQRNPEDPPANHVHHLLATLAPLTRIVKPAGHRCRQARSAVRLAQQERTPFARHESTVETRLDQATATGWK